MKILSSKYLSEHQYFTARVDSYELASGKVVDPYYVVEMPSSVVVMGVTEDENVVLVKQYRHPVDQILIELPGGFMDKDEQPQQTAEREMMEETGYCFENFYYLGITAANPGVLNNFCHLFLATGGKKTGLQKLDPNEEIEILTKPLTEVKLMLHHNEFVQSLHSLCLFYGFEKLEQLKS